MHLSESDAGGFVPVHFWITCNSTKSAIAFTKELRTYLTRLRRVLLVDCVSALSAFAKTSVLQTDPIVLWAKQSQRRLHLTPLAAT